MNEGTAYGPTAGADADMAELARMADELVDEIGSTRRYYDELRAMLDGDAHQATEGQDGGTATAVAVAGPAEEQAQHEEHEEHEDESGPSTEGARLVALNLALMGVDRADARIQLCDDFEIEPDTVDELLDVAFGVREGNGNGRSRARRFRRRNGNG